jgi:site-specific recombinase XerD
LFGRDHTLPGAPLFPSERNSTTGRPVTTRFRASLAEAVAEHLPNWTGKLTPHVLRHYCASQLYADGVDLLAIQALLGHSWVATTMRYIYAQSTRLEEAVARGQQQASDRWKGLVR